MKKELKKGVCAVADARGASGLFALGPNRKGGARPAAAGFRLPLSRKTAASRAEASSAPSRRSAHHLVARTTVGAPVGGFRRRMKTRNMLLQPPSRGHEVGEPHPAFVPMPADNHRQPAARVRHALPNCTTADDSLVIRRRLPNHMILTATRVACLCRHQWPLQWLWSQPWQRQRQHQRQHQRRQRRRRRSEKSYLGGAAAAGGVGDGGVVDTGCDGMGGSDVGGDLASKALQGRDHLMLLTPSRDHLVLLTRRMVAGPSAGGTRRQRALMAAV